MLERQGNGSLHNWSGTLREGVPRAAPLENGLPSRYEFLTVAPACYLGVQAVRVQKFTLSRPLKGSLERFVSGYQRSGNGQETYVGGRRQLPR